MNSLDGNADVGDPELARRLARIRERAAAACARVGREPEAVRLIGVSKTVQPERVVAARAAGLEDFVRGELLGVLEDILAWHRRGTRHGIHVDDDGLLYAGEPGVQLTWMDARVGDWVVTPRTGKPVEVNALWHAALRALAGFCADRDESEAATRYSAMAERAAASFRARFWRPELGYLADVLDTPCLLYTSPSPRDS